MATLCTAGYFRISARGATRDRLLCRDHQGAQAVCWYCPLGRAARIQCRRPTRRRGYHCSNRKRHDLTVSHSDGRKAQEAVRWQTNGSGNMGIAFW